MNFFSHAELTFPENDKAYYFGVGDKVDFENLEKCFF